ncbi:unnamed protein product [Citrullus colocynthis]|uniref:Uncharacterized protein n=1 Tax=Citrullus colocynthis TaxID=252529 RepID=A0ABP0Y0Y4_9ROSI
MLSDMLVRCLLSEIDNHISIYKKEYSFTRRNNEMVDDIQSEAKKRHDDDDESRSNTKSKFKGRRQKEEQKEKQRKWDKREKHQRQGQEQEPQKEKQIGQWWQQRPVASAPGRAST